MDIAGETNLLKLQMPLIVGTVPLQREFSKLEPVTTKDYKGQSLPLIPQRMETKYKKLRKLHCISLCMSNSVITYFNCQPTNALTLNNRLKHTKTLKITLTCFDP